ncbi:MAG: hypothetical protein WBC44_18850 [Planctomycetaceae bacterium]
MTSRREFLTATTAGLFAACLSRSGSAAGAADYDASVPVKVVTRGPRHHWFGYYDKWQFDPTDRYLLSNEVPFEHRSPTEHDAIKVGYVDLSDGDKWVELGDTRAWNWQQGCMLQWVPGTESTVAWNDREGNRFVCRLLDVKTGEGRTLPRAVYNFSPDGKTAISTDFRRLNDVRPGYGYAGLPDPNAEVLRPEDSGIWTIDVATGATKLVLSIADVAALGEQTPDVVEGKHWFNHLLFNTDGTRFIFLHRWKPDRGRAARWKTRMFTANADGSEPYILDSSGLTSHFIWRDPQHVCAWSGVKDPAGFYLFKDRTNEVTPVGRGVMTVDGHNTYLPIGDGTEWILCDTYPHKDRRQTVYLYHVPTGKRTDLGRFHLPVEYKGEWRCDTHPRASRSGKLVCIDAPHAKEGRQLHLLDISTIVG